MYTIVQHPSPNHSTRTEPISAIVLHHGAGTRQSDLSWLCNPASKVSAHYYVCRDATIYQLVDEARTAWHAGKATISNEQSIGIETEHTTLPDLPIQHTDWPQTQLDALAWLIGDIRTRYPIPLERVVSHRAIAMPKGRKSDPAHSPLAPEHSFRAWVASLEPPPPPQCYSPSSPLLAAPLATRAELRFVLPKGSTYKPDETSSFFDEYYAYYHTTGLDPIIAIAQMLHETNALRSWWCERPRRNPAGIGVTGRTQESPVKPRGEWSLNPDGLWHEGISYKTWIMDAIPDHVGRLLAYALPPASGTSEQQRLIARSFARRIIPMRVRGCAPTLAGLDETWAEDKQYSTKIVARANKLIGVT